MTKKEILQKHFTAEFGHDGHGEFMQYILDAMEEYAQQEVKKLSKPDVVSCSFPSDNDIENAALNYRDKSDDENTNEDIMMIEAHWYDKQEAFTAGVR